MPRPEVELMTDTALCAAVPDEPGPADVIPEAPAFRPCADMGILDEQLLTPFFARVKMIRVG